MHWFRPALKTCVSAKLMILLAVGLSSILNAQNPQGKTKVIMEYADLYKVNEEKYGKGIHAVFGNVRFRHQNSLMYCDSAYFNVDSNYVEAFSHIHMIQGDSLHLYGDRLDYAGNLYKARVRDNVKMTKGDVVLTTQYLDYDRLNQVGYYFNGGKIVDKQNTLTSEWGYYYPNSNEAFFKDSVVVNNPDYTILSDTLKYNTTSKVAKILGPTFVVSDSNLIYSENGYYDTQNNYAQLLENSYVQGKQQLLKGDTINYNRTSGIAEVYSNMELIDTTNHVIIKGNYGYYNELTKTAFATQHAQFLHLYNNDTLFMHADTLRSEPIPDTESNLIRAYHKVKFFRTDLQGRCDSMVYNMLDSTNTFYHDPVIWAQGSQMTAQMIKMYTKNELLDRVELNNSAFVISPEDSSRYNQIKGRNMLGYIRNNELYKIDVDGNGQTIYYPKDKETTIGVNRAESSNMTIFFKNKKPAKIIMRVTPTGNLNPPMLLKDEEVKLSGFVWLESFRPKNKLDIFRTDEIPQMEERPVFDDFIDAGVGNIKPGK